MLLKILRCQQVYFLIRKILLDDKRINTLDDYKSQQICFFMNPNYIGKALVAKFYRLIMNKEECLR